MRGIRVAQRVRDVGHPVGRIAQHPLRGLPPHLGDEVQEGEAVATQPPLQRAAAGAQPRRDQRDGRRTVPQDRSNGPLHALDVQDGLAERSGGALPR